MRGCVNQPFTLFIHHIWGETVLSITQTSDRMRYFTILQFFKSSCTQSIFRTINGGLLLCLFFLFKGFITMCNLKKRSIPAAFWILLKAMFINDWKQTAQRLKLQERLLTINKRNIIRWSIYRGNNFHSRDKYYSVSPGVCSSQRWTRGKNIAQTFLSTAKFITKYCSERFLSICGEKIYLKAF